VIGAEGVAPWGRGREVGAATATGGCAGVVGAVSCVTEGAACSFSATDVAEEEGAGDVWSAVSAVLWEEAAAEEETVESPEDFFVEEGEEALGFEPLPVVECFLEGLFADDFFDLAEEVPLPLDFLLPPEDWA